MGFCNIEPERKYELGSRVEMSSPLGEAGSNPVIGEKTMHSSYWDNGSIIKKESEMSIPSIFCHH